MSIIRICGLDLSLTSSGFSVADCLFEEKIKNSVSDNLFNFSFAEETFKNFQKFVDFKIHTGIIEDKSNAKVLAKTRKLMREDEKETGEISFENLKIESNLITKRMIFQVENVLKLLDEYKPELVFMEDYSYHSQGSITYLAELRGCFKTLLTHEKYKDYVILTAPITSVKKIGGTKGNATKQMMFHWMRRFGLDINEKTDDITDSMAIVISAFYAMYFKLFGIEFPADFKKKDIESWEKALRVFGNHVGTKKELLNWMIP